MPRYVMDGYLFVFVEKCVVSSAKCVVVEGAHKIWKRPNTLFI